jgi:hypothetical protein
MVDREKQEANDKINGSMKKSNSEREQTEVAFFTERFRFFFLHPNNRGFFIEINQSQMNHRFPMNS